MTEWTVVAGVDSSATASEIDTVANNIANVNIVGGISSDVTAVAGIASDVTSVSSISGNVTTVAGIDSNVTTVAGISGEITTVANDGTDIGVVAANTSNINTVAGINSDVTTVAGISSDVTTVAADGTDIGTVATDIANINTTAGSILNVNTVATNIANVNTVAADGTDIGVVAGISSDVTTVSGINANVTTVAGISADVTSVAGDAADIGTVATNIANVNTTAGSIANVNTVATDISNVNSVASNSTNINAVAANETNINAVNSNSTNINTVASNDTNITTVATDIANVNTTASNITDVNSFAERYRIDSSDPTTSLDAGDLVFNTTDSALKYYNGTSWTSITPGLTDIVGDVTPQLGGNLDLNSNDITGTGNINTTGNLTISGDLTVNGTTTTINSTTISVDDKNIELGATASPTDLTADGGGITLKGSTDHTLNWVNSTDAWTSSEHLNLATGKEYKINNTSLKDVSETLTNKTINSASNTITITESNISDLGSYLENVVEDTTPQLGGDLDLNSNDITGTGNIDITGNLTATGNLTSTGIDDNATSTAITIDSNERVGIGTNALSYNGLALKGRLEIRTYSDDNSGGWIETTEESGASNGLEINANRGSGKIVFSTNTSERMRIDSSGNVGIGTSSPGFQMDIQGSSNNALRLKTSSPILRLEDSDDNAHHTLIGSSDDLYITSDAGNTGAGNMIFRNGGTTERMRITSSGNVGIGTSSPEVKFHIENGSDNASIVRIEGADSTSEYLGFGVNSGLAVIQAGGIGSTSTGIQFNTSNAGTESEAMRITSSGNVGIGTSNPARELHISDSGTPSIRIQDTGGTNQYAEMLVSGSAIILQARNDTSDGNIVFRGLGGGTATEHMRISSAGNVGIGTTSPSTNLQIKANDNLTTTFPLRITNNAGTGYTDFGAYAIDTLNVDLVLKAGGNTSITIDKDTGYVGIGTTAPFNPLIVVGDAVTPVAINRETNDGQLISFRQDGVQEGSISVSGTTVSYNGGHLSRWGRLPDGSQPTILKGTVMSNLDEMVVWSYDDVLYTEEDELPVDDDGNPTASVGDVKIPAYTAENEQRNQLKVSDVEGDINVAGLFVKWDTEEDGYNDIDLAMTGDMIIRIAQGTTVQRGDLLMSAGDGTAKPQGDDIVRSKTIAKVTSTTVINTYDDGSYVVPCVVMAC